MGNSPAKECLPIFTAEGPCYTAAAVARGLRLRAAFLASKRERNCLRLDASKEPKENPMRPRLIALCGVTVLLLAGSVWAHHNMSAIFDFNNRVTSTGTLAKI